MFGTELKGQDIKKVENNCFRVSFFRVTLVTRE